MNFVKIFLAALGGFILGAMLSHTPFYTPTVNAQGKSTIEVTRAILVSGRGGGVDVPSGQIVGFSCVSNND